MAGNRAENRDRAGEDHDRWSGPTPAGLEDRTREIEVVRHAEIEVTLGLAAHRGGEVHDEVDVAEWIAGELVGEIAHEHIDTGIAGEVGRWRDAVE